jgi:hypothetical protein
MNCLRRNSTNSLAGRVATPVSERLVGPGVTDEVTLRTRRSSRNSTPAFYRANLPTTPLP